MYEPGFRSTFPESSGGTSSRKPANSGSTKASVCVPPLSMYLISLTPAIVLNSSDWKLRVGNASTSTVATAGPLGSTKPPLPASSSPSAPSEATTPASITTNMSAALTMITLELRTFDAESAAPPPMITRISAAAVTSAGVGPPARNTRERFMMNTAANAAAAKGRSSGSHSRVVRASARASDPASRVVAGVVEGVVPDAATSAPGVLPPSPPSPGSASVT